jgi:hypothetical protein
MPDEKEIREVVREEKRSGKTGKYKPLPRNKQRRKNHGQDVLEQTQDWLCHQGEGYGSLLVRHFASAVE